MYFLTKRDPNYSIKGSRDPLGFQVIWQEAGRRVIPHLSTVSSSVRDFQILCIAHACKNELKIPDAEFENFFIRLEQVLGYTRFIYCNDDSFNGIDRVKKRADRNIFTISTNPDDQLMSNQKAYGIWGKYIRPFMDTELTKHPDFDSAYGQKLRANPDFNKVAKQLKDLPPAGSRRIDKAKLENFQHLLDQPFGKESELLSSHLLKDNFHGELLRIVRQKRGFREGVSLFALLDTLGSESENGAFLSSLDYIRNTEMVLSPLNRIFRYLQTKSYWSFREIKADEFIAKWRTTPDAKSLHEPSRTLATLLRASNADLVGGLMERNKEVADWRNAQPWIRRTPSGLEVYHYEGARFDESYDPTAQSDNSYFLYTFLNIYRQLN